MEMYFLKSAACLAILLLFYKLLLENEKMHRFKRFYLLASVIISIIIPFVTFTTYVEVPPVISNINHETSSISAIQKVEKEVNFLPLIFWSIYTLGFLFFSFIFLKNIRKLILKIKRNPKLKNNHITHVLLQEEVTPHTFWNYIFLNKQKFENHAIPQEVFRHEEAHANQKHSFDILLMELLQIIFWFNPLIYFTKNAIKLNHEFLADEEVLKNGANTALYQETLLSFSSNQLNNSLSNSINYSSTRLTIFGRTFSSDKFGQVKKRFTVMKTKTSKKAIWARTLLLVPLLAALVYSCSQKEIIQRETTGRSSSVMVKGKATPEMMAEYNALAKFYNSQPKNHTVVRVKDFRRMNYIHKLMSPEQKENSEKYPDILLPPPPPPPAPPTPQKAETPPLPPLPPVPEIPEAIDPASLPPLPPPPPDEHIKNLAKEGAYFYFENKKITAKKAIELVESTKDLRIQIINAGGDKPTVQMFSE